MRSFLLSCIFALTIAASAHGKLLTADQVREVEPLLPYFTWLIDPSGNQTINAVAAGTLQERFAPLPNGIPLNTRGAVWLRLTIIKSPPTPTGGLARVDRSRLVMRLGELPPGGAQLFTAESSGPASEGSWRGETVTSHSDVLLPEPGLLPMTIFLRMDSMPGLWFAPTVSPQGSVHPDLLPSKLLLPGLLIVACAACLLRAIANRAQWALWAALFLMCVLAQTILPLPAPYLNITVRDLPVMLAPGMALVLLPHVGRCMLRTNMLSTLQDALLYLCSILGVVVCLAPLTPGMSWLARIFPLWPLLLFPLLPVCVSALANKRPGALAFSGACGMSILGAVLSFYAINMPNPHYLATQGSFWGLAIGGLGLALARIPKEVRKESPRISDSNAAPHIPDADAIRPGSWSEQPSASSDWQTRQDSLPSLEMQGPARAKKPALHLDISQLAGQAREDTLLSAPITETPQAEPAGEAFQKIAAPFSDPATAAEPVLCPTPEQTVPASGSEQDQQRLSEFGQSPAHAAPAEQQAEPQAIPATGGPHLTAVEPEDPSLSWNPEDPAYTYMVGGLTFGFSPPPSPHGDALALSSESSGLAPSRETRSSEDSAIESNKATAPVPDPCQEAPPSVQDTTGTDAPAVRPTWEPSVIPADAAVFSVQESPASAPLSEPGESDRLPVDTEKANAFDAPHPSMTAKTAAPEFAYAAPYEAGLLPEFSGTSDALAPLMENARVISLVEEDFSAYHHPLLDDLQEETSRHTTLTASGGFLFNLHSLVREVHDIVVPLAKNKGLLFSWYITPSLPTLLEGDAPRLRGALSLLLQNAVQATQQGAVQLAVRRNPGGSEPGDLLFSISDSGSAQRTDAGFFHAWELAARTGGAFNIDYSPGGGTQITFTAHFALPSEDAAREHLIGLAKPVRWEQTDAAPALTNPEMVADIAILPEDRELEDLDSLNMRDSHEQDRELDNDEPISVLWNRSSPPTSSTEEPGSPYPPEDPELAALTPEQVLERQDFLEVSPVPSTPALTVPDAPAPAPIPAKTGFRSQADMDQPGVAPLIVAAEMTNSKRKLLSHYLGELPHEHVDAANNSQVIALLREKPIALVIFDADMPEPDIIKTLATLRQEEKKLGLRTGPVLALTNHEAQSQRMRKAGATHSLCKPFSKEGLLEIVTNAIPSLAAAMPRPAGAPKAEERDAAAGSTVAAFAGTASIGGNPASGSAVGDSNLAEATADFPRPSAETDPFVAFIRSGHAKRTPFALSGSADTLAAQATAPSDTEVDRPIKHHPLNGHDLLGHSGLEETPSVASSGEDSPLEASRHRPPAEDLLEAALRDAPVQQGQPVLVSLPSLREASEPVKREEVLQAAPMILGLSTDDVTPYAGQSDGPPLLDLILTENEATLETSATAIESGPEALAERNAVIPAEKSANTQVETARPTPTVDKTTSPAETARPAGPEDVSGIPSDKNAQSPAGDAVTTRHEGATFAPTQEQIVAAPAKAASDGVKRAPSAVRATVVVSRAPGRAGHTPTASQSPAAIQATVRTSAASQSPPVPQVPAAVHAPGVVQTSAATVQVQATTPVNDVVHSTAEAQPRETVQAPTVPEPFVEIAAKEDPLPPDAIPDVRPQTEPSTVQEASTAEHSESSSAAEDSGRDTTEPTPPGEDTPASTASATAEGEPQSPETPYTEHAPLALALEDAIQAAVETALPDEDGAPGVLSETPSDLGETALVGASLDASTPPTRTVDASPDAPAPSTQAEVPQVFSLPGLEGESVDMTILPLVPGLIHALEDALNDARQGRDAGKTILVQEAAGRLAGRSETFGLHKLGKIGRCVERAAEADDLEAVSTLLEDLEIITKRYITALQDAFQSFLNIDR